MLDNLFSGVRHDSGDPYAWGEQIIKHYKSLGFTDDYIKTKTLLFSDSLDFERATKIYDYFKDRTKVAFGIGTWLSNDCGKEPLNIVMKLTRVNDHPVAKLSDNLGKTICTDTAYIDYLQRAIAWRLGHEE
jgi:nicotinate phosphoribosyltransferase